MTGYVRQSTADIATSEPITAAPLNAEFNQIQSAFNATTGHSHDASVGNAPKIILTTSVSGVLPVANGGTNAATAAAARTSLFGVSTTVDNTLARYDGTAGALQTSPIVVSDAGAMSGITTLTTTSSIAASAIGVTGIVSGATGVFTGNVSSAGSIIDGTNTSGGVTATTSGTSIDFALPSWVQKITVMLSGVSTNGTGVIQLVIGDSGGSELSGYSGALSIIASGSSPSNLNLSSGFTIGNGAAANTLYGTAVLTLLNSSTNLWACSSTMGHANDTTMIICAGTKALSAVIESISLVSSSTFDAGSMNILYSS